MHIQLTPFEHQWLDHTRRLNDLNVGVEMTATAKHLEKVGYVMKDDDDGLYWITDKGRKTLKNYHQKGNI